MEEQQGSDRWITLEAAVLIIWYFIDGTFCVVLTVAALIFLSETNDPSSDNSCSDDSDYNDSDCFGTAGDVARYMVFCAVVSVAIDVIGILSLRVPSLRAFRSGPAIVVIRGFLVIFWLALLIAGLSPNNLFDIYMRDGTGSTAALVAIVFIIQMVSFIARIVALAAELDISRRVAAVWSARGSRGSRGGTSTGFGHAMAQV